MQNIKQLEQSLVNKVARRCIHLLHGTNFKAWIQFWQTWANLEAIPFIASSNYFTKDVQEQAIKRGKVDWAKIQLNNTTGVPSVYKSIPGFFKNNNFWDPNNKTIIWDDRLWLGNSYLFLYMVFRVQSYLLVAVQLYKFIIISCADWRAENYRGLEWKPGTDYRNSITNQLFFVFCCRLYHITHESHYLDAAKAQYRLLFCQIDKYINHNKLNIFPDADSNQGFYSYNQGVALEGLAYLIVYGNNYQEYMGQLVRLTSGMIQYFRNKNQPKLIMKQFATGDHQYLRTSSIFRSFVFRHLLHLFRILPSQTFNDYKQRVPFLRTFILDNAQAMCKYQNLSPCYNWEKYNDGIIHDYNAFNMFYVLLAAVEMFNINQIVVSGIMVPSDGNLTVEIGTNIRGLYISTFNFDSQGVYKRGERKLMKVGTYSFQELLRGESLTFRENNRNIMQITVLTINNQQIPITIAHIEGQASLFALIPDQLGQSIINNFIVRIKTHRLKQGLKYPSRTQLYQAQLMIPIKTRLTPLVISVV